jgi:hypothetical protein
MLGGSIQVEVDTPILSSAAADRTRNLESVASVYGAGVGSACHFPFARPLSMDDC